MPTPNKNNNTEDLKWLSQHRQSIEHRNRMLKGAGVFSLCFALGFAFAAFIALIFSSAIDSLIALAIFLCLTITLIVANPPDEYVIEMFFGTIGGVFIGLIITLTLLVPMANVAQYPISMQVFYPNHPNLTITQKCTGFTTSESSYFNGEPINETNTTTCILPHSIANTTYPFTCSIQNKTITCNVANYYIWKGTILNVSKR